MLINFVNIKEPINSFKYMMHLLSYPYAIWKDDRGIICTADVHDDERAERYIKDDGITWGCDYIEKTPDDMVITQKQKKVYVLPVYDSNATDLVNYLIDHRIPVDNIHTADHRHIKLSLKSIVIRLQRKINHLSIARLQVPKESCNDRETRKGFSFVYFHLGKVNFNYIL